RRRRPPGRRGFPPGRRRLGRGSCARASTPARLTRRPAHALERGPMQLADFDFDPPDDRIALRPAHPRDSARLLLVEPGAALRDLRVADLPDLLRAGDVLVLNDTKVIPARLKGRRVREGSIVACEATLHQRKAAHRWTAFMRPGKKL